MAKAKCVRNVFPRRRVVVSCVPRTFTSQEDPDGKLAAKEERRCASLTQQHFREESDINYIVRKHRVRDGTGRLRIDPALAGHRQHSWGDFTQGADFQDSMNRIRSAESQFARLPSHVRFKFRNDISLLLDFLDKPENAKEAADLGLLPPPGESEGADSESASSASQDEAEDVVEDSKEDDKASEEAD